VSYAELLSYLFGDRVGTGEANTIGVYVRRVRRKIEDTPDYPRHIVTVRGRGYRFHT
jgi:two-component system, OmpR family, response regulator RegX3